MAENKSIAGGGLPEQPQHTDERSGGFAADKPLHIELGAVEIGRDGHIRAALTREPVNSRFTAFGLPFKAEFDRGDGGRLRLEADLGKLYPDRVNAGIMALLQRLIDTATKLPGGRITVTEKARLLLAETVPPVPHTPLSVISATVSMVLGFAPYLRLAMLARNLHDDAVEQAQHGAAG